jgi:hypothetical protein
LTFEWYRPSIGEIAVKADNDINLEVLVLNAANLHFLNLGNKKQPN